MSCQQAHEESADLLYLLPEKATAVLKIPNLPQLTEELNRISFISENAQLPFIQFLSDSYAPVRKLQISKESLLFYTRIGRDEVATSLITPVTKDLLNEVGYDERESIKYNGVSIKLYPAGEKTTYGVKLNGLFAWSDSKLVIENMVRLSQDKFMPQEKLQKLYNSVSARKPAILINTDELEKLSGYLLPGMPAYLQNFTDWIALDFQLKNEQIFINGVTMPGEKEVLRIFNGTQPRVNRMAEIVPAGAYGFYSITYDNFEKLKDNITFYRKTAYPEIETEFLASAVEVGHIFTPESSVTVVKPADDEKAASLLADQQVHKTFRDIPVYKVDLGDYFTKGLSPFIRADHIGFYAKVKGFYIFAETAAALEYVIAGVQNNKTLVEEESYQSMTKNMDDKSSLLLVGLTRNLINPLSESVATANKSAYQKIKTADYEQLAVQFINHDNFNYVNGVFAKSKAVQNLSGGLQLRSVKAEEEIKAGPWFFENWRTKHYDVVFQDASHTLYSYDENGKLNWKKKLKNRILGDIQPIDIYQNGRIQMAFTTADTFYIIDRLGNVVKPFEMAFKDPITQPLALFDYSNNGRFRFLITQGNELLMLDKQLNKVSGFNFTKAQSDLLYPPRHYRIGNKDYILIAEASGQLHILNPQGNTRVKVDRKINFSDNEWYENNGHFISTDKEGNLIRIDQNGKINVQALKLKENHHLTATSKRIVTFSENRLMIDNKTIRMDYGLYLPPEIHYINNKIYISITDLQAHKVYLFDSAGNMMNGFPVYGNSAADLQDMNRNGSPELLVKGEGDSVLIYATD